MVLIIVSAATRVGALSAFSSTIRGEVGGSEIGDGGTSKIETGAAIGTGAGGGWTGGGGDLGGEGALIGGEGAAGCILSNVGASRIPLGTESRL